MEARAVDVALVVVSVLITEQFIRVCLSLFHEFTDKFSLLLRELSTSLCAPANEYNPQETLQFLLDRSGDGTKQGEILHFIIDAHPLLKGRGR